MIVEKFPELEKLEPSDQLILASELARSAMNSGGIPELSPQSVHLLENRLDHYLKNPDSGVRWEDLKNRRPAS